MPTPTNAPGARRLLHSLPLKALSGLTSEYYTGIIRYDWVGPIWPEKYRRPGAKGLTSIPLLALQYAKYNTCTPGGSEILINRASLIVQIPGPGRLSHKIKKSYTQHSKRTLEAFVIVPVLYNNATSPHCTAQKSSQKLKLEKRPCVLDPCGLAARSDPPVVPSGPLGVSHDPPLCPPALVVSLCPPVLLVSLLIPPRVLRCPWCLLGPKVV
jgi:hypothetical protein